MEQRILNVDQLHPGCVLAKNITKNGDVLFVRGRELSERDIESMKRWNIHRATIKKETLRNQSMTP